VTPNAAVTPNALDDRLIELTVFDWLEAYFGDDRARRDPGAPLVRRLRMDGDDAPSILVDLQRELDTDLPHAAWERVDSPADAVAAFRGHRGPTGPYGVRRPRWYPESRFPCPSRMVEVDGHLVHYVDEGDGPPLLLLHGNPTWSFLYREVIGRLSRRFRCVALDYPGFGLSHAREGYDFRPASHAAVVEGFVRALDLGDLTVMGQDWGGPIGLAVAGRDPGRIRGLVLGNTFAWPLTGAPHFERFAWLMGGPIGRVAIRRLNAFVNLMLPAGVKRTRLPADVMAAYRAPMRLPRRRMATAVFPRELTRSAAWLAEVETGLAHLAHLPTLLLWGDRDRAFRTVELERFEGTLPRHRTVILAGAGHFIQEDAPQEIAHAIERWYDEVVRGR
jgi:haloalkane dehalogenase